MCDKGRNYAACVLMIVALAIILFPVVMSENRSNPSFTGMNYPFQLPVYQKSTGTVSINDGDVDELTRLYGIGETLAGMIIKERETNGPFFYPEDLTSVKGIGMGKLSRFKDELDY